jgi:hypothetical protein
MNVIEISYVRNPLSFTAETAEVLRQIEDPQDLNEALMSVKYD